jgi:cyclase
MTVKTWWVLIVGLAFAAVAAGAGGVRVTKAEIADGIFLFTTARDGYVPNGNSVVVVNQSDVLVFDTFSRPSTARTVLAEIQKITSKPVRYVVNSHWHPDHWNGNEVYAEAFPDVQFIATEETRQAMVNVANAWPKLYASNLKKDQAAFDEEVKNSKQADGSELTDEQRRYDEETLRLEASYIAEASALHRVYPTLTYVDRLTLRHGGREFRFLSMVGDANGETVMYLPKEKVLVTGDVVSGPVPYYSPPLSQHARSLRVLRDMDAEVIVPGHGPAIRDKAYLHLELELFDAIVKQVLEAVKREVVSAEEIQKFVNVEYLRTKFTNDDPMLNRKFRRYVTGMIENAAREARDGREFKY